mgnify:CR=1 FL=1
MNIDEQLEKASTPEDIELIFKQRELDKFKRPKGAGYRNTYKESHALKLAPFFEDALNNSRDVCIPFSAYPSCGPKRFYQIVCDSIKFLVDQDLKKWAAFRTQIYFEVSQDAREGIWITWKTRDRGGKLRSEHAMAAGVSDTGGANIRTRVEKWLESDRTEQLRITGLNLSLETQQELSKLFEACDVEAYVVKIDRVLAS